MKKPNLLIVGHPRTGTSSLHDYLSQHPDIFMSPIKEPNFFASDFHGESDKFHNRQLYFPLRSESKYLRLYDKCRREKIAGEASATTLFSKRAAEEISRFNPKAKIIMTFREPVDFLFSLHSTAVFSLGENIKDFSSALAAEDDRKKGALLSKRVIVPSWLFYSEYINYTAQAKRFLEYFPEDQIKINIFDDFKTNTYKSLEDIFTFLEIDSMFKPDLSVVNPYKKGVKWPKLKHYVFDSPFFRKFVRTLIPMRIYARLVPIYKKTILTNQTKQVMDPSYKQELKVQFKDEVDKFGNFIGKDLIHLWRYDTI